MKVGYRLSTIVWWLGAAILLFSQLISTRTAGTVRVLESIVPEALVRPLWHAPLSYLQSAQSFGEWPIWLVAAVTSVFVLAVVAGGRLQRSWATAFCLLPICLLAKPEQLPIAIVVFLFCKLVSRSDDPTRPWTLFTQLVVLAVIGFAVSIEFGIVLLGCLAYLLGELIFHRKAGSGRLVFGLQFGVLASVVAAIVLLNQPLASALFRPLGNAWFSIDPSLFPSQAIGLLTADWSQLLSVAWLAVVAMLTLMRLWTTDGRRGGLALVVVFFTFVAVVSPAHLWVALVGIGTIWLACDPTGQRQAMSSAATVGVQPASGTRVTIVASLVLVSAFLHLGWVCQNHGTDFLLIGQQRHVETQTWNVDGPVVLTNLEHTSHWVNDVVAGRLQLALADRWDDRSGVLTQYSDFVHDLTSGRREHYVRSDGSMGGYWAFMQKLQPSLIALDSTQHQSIRMLSVDSDWSTMAIDAQRTIFGRTKDPQTQAAIRRAGELFYFLEWPNPRKRVEIAGALQVGTAHDSRKVSGVLNAIRLPYAAMRVLPSDGHTQTDVQKIQCYVEIAHRVHRQAGQRSLLDHTRAVTGLRKLLDENWLSARQRAMLQRQLKVLMDLRPSRKHPLDEAAVRDSLCRCQWQVADGLISKLADQSSREFYLAILELLKVPGDDASVVFAEVVSENTMSPRLADEGLFYLGCVEIEQKSPENAIVHFRKSQLFRGQQSPFFALKMLYLSQLGALQD